ncbi:hypothetical protein KKH23_04340, partial [Patescibacteria group bacterium]|nr:hypothetical protein [Patescibacteria group bacterium]
MGESKWKIIEQGSDYIRKQNADFPHKYSWESQPPKVFDGKEYVPYIYNETAEYHQIQTAFIAARIYKSGFAEFWKPDMAKIQVHEETWELQYRRGKKWRVCGTYNPEFVIESDDKNISITLSFVTDYPNAGERAFTVKYIFREGQPLKHEIKFISYASEIEIYRVIQKWSGIAASKLNGNRIESSTKLNTTQLKFTDSDAELVVYEDQEPASKWLNPVYIDIHPQGLKADFTFSEWQLNQGDELLLDPATVTYTPADGGFIRKEGAVYGEYNTAIRVGTNAAVSRIYRGFVQWTITTIPDTATIIDSALRYEGVLHVPDCHIHAITNKPSISSATTIYNDAGSGTVFVDPPGFPVTGINQEQNLGAAADADIKAHLVANWFAIGIQADNEAAGNFSDIALIVGSTPQPTLYVEYSLYTDASATLKGVFTIRQASSADLKGVFTVRHTETKDLYAKFEAQATAILKGVFIVRNASSAALKGIFIIRLSSSAALKGILIISRSSTTGLKGLLVVKNASSAALKGILIVRHSSNVTLRGVFIVQHSSSANLKGIFIVRNASSAALKGVFIIRLSSSAALKGIFILSMQTGAGDLYAKFEAQATAALFADFELAQWEDLKGILVARHSLSAALKGVFIVRHSSSAALKGIFIVRHMATKDLYAKFEAQAALDLYANFEAQATAALKGVFIVRQADIQNLYAKFELAQWEDLKGIFIVRHASSVTLKGIFIVRHSSSANLRGIFAVRHTAIKDLYAKFGAQAVLDLYARFETQGVANLYAKFTTQATTNLRGIFIVRQASITALKGIFIVRHASSVTLKGIFIVRHSSSAN